jgi:elongation factor Ts
MTRATPNQIRELRALSSAGMMDCKRALEATGGDLEKAAEHLRQLGFANAEKRDDRPTPQGVVGSYVHHNGKLAALVEVNCETDFVARTDTFQTLARQIAEHVAGTSPVAGDVEELLAQPWVREPGLKIADLVRGASAKLGENVQVGRFARVGLGG